MLIARMQQWVAREQSDDPLQRPIVGLRELHTHGGLLLAATGGGIIAASFAGVLVGAAVASLVFGIGIFFLGRWP